jgi:hypothetical protein
MGRGLGCRIRGRGHGQASRHPRRGRVALADHVRDYGELAFRGRLRLPPAIVLLRIVSYRPAEPAEWIERVLASEKAAEGGFFVVDRLGLRWRPLPADRE